METMVDEEASLEETSQADKQSVATTALEAGTADTADDASTQQSATTTKNTIMSLVGAYFIVAFIGYVIPGNPVAIAVLWAAALVACAVFSMIATLITWKQLDQCTKVTGLTPATISGILILLVVLLESLAPS